MSQALVVELQIGDGLPFVPDQWIQMGSRVIGTETRTRPEDKIVQTVPTSASCWEVEYEHWHQHYHNFFLHGKWESTSENNIRLHVWGLNKIEDGQQ